MSALPSRLTERMLTGRRVVAPVDCGALQDELVAWARARGWTVLNSPVPGVEEPPGDGEHDWLWLPRSRRRLSLGHGLHEALILSGEDVRLSWPEWQAALPNLPEERQEASFRAFEGWPGALAVARTVDTEPAAAHRHPATAVQLGPVMPPLPLRAAASALAVSPLITPGVGEALGVNAADLDALIDGGWLWAAPAGWAFPALLRRTLCPSPPPEAARAAALALQDIGQDAAALDTLAEAEAWAAYLDLLALVARSGQGESSLRARWERLPARWREAAPGRYLAGLLARTAGDVVAAEALYSDALPHLRGALHAQASNARGVVRAMRGAVEDALRDFAAGAAAGGVSAGEANQNRATLLVQLGRHAEAEQSLGAAVAAFRAAGDRLREAHSLETLGALQFGRGLLQEALPPYRKALGLFLPGHPAEAALVHLNLAECLTPLGELDQANRHLAAATDLMAESPSTASAAGWLHRARALLALAAADPALALTHLSHIHTDDRSLTAEAALLAARAWRELRQPEQARAALLAAHSLGLRAALELALLGGPLDAVIEAARLEEARLELATALLGRARPGDLSEALGLIRTHGYLALLDSQAAAPLASLAQDAETRALFPLRLHLLGPLRFVHAGRTVQLADFPTRKSAALLVALALAEHPQPREVLAERFWPGAKNPLASLQTAVYHLRSVFGVPLVGSERGQLSLLFPVRSDLATLRRALGERDLDSLSALLRPLTAPLSVLPELPAELDEERQQAERLLHDALRVHAQAQPAGDRRRRDALRTLIAADPLDLDARDDLIRWHEAHGEGELADQERRGRDDARRVLES